MKRNGKPRPAFEEICESLGITSFEQMKTNSQLKNWVVGNYLTKYVPETLITAFGLPTPEEI